jgi:hypothetical protein
MTTPQHKPARTPATASRGCRSLAFTLLAFGVATGAATPGVAQAAPKQVPCALSAGHYNCQWYRAGDGVSAGSIVVAGGKLVGYLHKGTNWINCQQSGAAVHSPEGYENAWYGWTQADDGQAGWASALDASGGDNNGNFATVPSCNGAHGAAPSVSGLWGTTPPVAPVTAPAPVPAPGPVGPHGPPPMTETIPYETALETGFGTLPKLESRHVWNAGAIDGDQGVVVLRFFIPHETAAGKSLLGDNRSFDASVDMRDKSRAWLVWNTATGQASVTVAPSTIGPLVGIFPEGKYLEGSQISALKINAKNSADDVKGTEDTLRFSNDAYLERTSNNGVRLRISLLNSLTNKVPLAAWSVDADIRIDPKSDATNPSFERYAATRSTAQMSRRHRLTRAQRKRSGLAILCLSGKVKPAHCKSLRKSLVKASRGAVKPNAAATPRNVPPATNAASAAAAASAPNGAYSVSMLGNGYPAIEAYYYPRYEENTRVLFRRRVDPDKLNSVAARTLDSGGGVGALDRFSWFNCTSRADGGSDCQNALPGEDGKSRRLDIGLVEAIEGPGGILLSHLPWVSRLAPSVSPDSYSTDPNQDAQAK